MKIFFRRVAVLAICGLMGCATQPSVRRVALGNFALTVPQNAEVVKRYSMEDFEVYDCSLSGLPLFSFYIGNAASFPHDKKARIIESTLSGMAAKEIRVRKGRASSREVLVKVSEKQWPRQVHFWYGDLSQEKRETADGIIQSIKAVDHAQ